MNVNRLLIGTRLKNILFVNGVDTVDDIIKLGPDKLLSSSELGYKSLSQLLWAVLTSGDEKEEFKEESCVMFLLDKGYTLAKPK